MPAKKPKAAKVSEHDIDGHSVRIVEGPDQEELWIDGTRRRFFKNEQGYLLADRAYVPSNASLLDAVRQYLKQADPPKSAARKGGR
jgi:hypothetical protein